MSLAVAAAERSARRRAATERDQMLRGVGWLPGIAATAPLLGLVANVFGIFGSFRGFNGEKSTIMAALAGSLAESIIPTALGLAIAIPAWCCHRYLAAQVEEFTVEMESAVLELSNYLRRA